MEITIVTAYFDVGRGKWTGFERDNNKYVEYFKFWARMKNKLVVYTDERTAQQVLQIRDAFGLKEKTQTVIIDDIRNLDPIVYEKMEKVLANDLAVKFRTKPNNPESYVALYNYLMYLKPYFITDAIQRGFADRMVAWMDFGYNHGGELYANPLDFDFLWEYDFSSKINLFAIKKLDDMPIFEIVRTMECYFTGSLFVAPAELWKIVQQLFRKAVLNLASCGLCDDDQTLMVMAYREQSDLFEIHYTENFTTQLKDCGGAHLTVVQKKQYKQSKKKARKLWQDSQYGEALKWYWKYAVEKLQLK